MFVCMLNVIEDQFQAEKGSSVLENLLNGDPLLIWYVCLHLCNFCWFIFDLFTNKGKDQNRTLFLKY